MFTFDSTSTALIIDPRYLSVRYWAGIGCLILFSASAFADTPVATASSTANFVLRGSEIAVEGVPSWPVFGGDEIAAGKADVFLKFSCGSRVRLDPGASARVMLEGSTVTVHLLKGDLSYKRSKGCPLAMVGLDGAAAGVATAAGTAALVKGAIILGPLAAAGTGYAISQAVGGTPSNPPSVSPSH